LAVLLCFAFGCQKKAEKAELEKSGAQPEIPSAGVIYS
jgi:hypothetical protein